MVMGLGLERRGWFLKENRFIRGMRRFSAMSLEIYVVQGAMIGIASHFTFPTNIVIAVVLTISGAAVLHKVTTMINKIHIF